MARTYIQTTRILKSYEAYERQIQTLSAKGIATIEALPYNIYRKIYVNASKSGTKNIARTIAYQYNQITTQAEARNIRNRIIEEVGTAEEIASIKELRGYSGKELWAYMQDMGLSEREAGAAYDGDERVYSEEKGRYVTRHTARTRR